MIAIPAAVTAELATLVASVLSGRLSEPGEISRRLVELGLDLVPVEELRQYLVEADRARAERLADLAEAAKFGGGQ
ncbi:MAG: hypothetical protein FWD69_10080 [Polyangiaceae bacterium]|nr:hypothetical protein [Polyangiaceae bacterium]